MDLFKLWRLINFLKYIWIFFFLIALNPMNKILTIYVLSPSAFEQGNVWSFTFTLTQIGNFPRCDTYLQRIIDKNYSDE
jgi:hypothetical protein